VALSSDEVASADVVDEEAVVDDSDVESSFLLQPAAVTPMTRAATAKLVTDKRAISMDFLSGTGTVKADRRFNIYITVNGFGVVCAVKIITARSHRTHRPFRRPDARELLPCW
jgi:hypothetical protein